jgi:hypothetical protein
MVVGTAVRAVVVWGCAAMLLLAPGTARGSQQIGDVNVSNLTLAVNAKGEALLTYTRQNGQLRHLLAWGAVNALPPSQTVPQVRFQLDYTGGLASHHNPGYWKGFRNVCSPYTGPQLVDLVAACDAPDGSYWAVQSWQRQLPMRGFAPWKPSQSDFDFDLSHWSGPIAELDVSQNWTYGGAWTGLFGRLTYDGSPVFGYTTASPTKRGDGYGRYVYIDTFNSVYGPGWKHDTAITLHVGDGAFCYSFVPQAPPPGYPDTTPRAPGNGQLERVTVIGPGVTPDVQWVGPGLGAYDPAQDAVYNALFDQLVGPNDRVCANER